MTTTPKEARHSLGLGPHHPPEESMTHEEQMRVCPECGGVGRCDYDVPVVDYINGGFIDSVSDTCELCEGAGEIADNYGEEE